MQTERFILSPPSLEELAGKISDPLSSNFEYSNVEVVQCPDLRRAPFNLATEGLSGNERIADVGGQANLFPSPRLDNIWSMRDLATAMDMDVNKGSLIGAGAGPFHQVGRNCELVPNLSWDGNLAIIDNQSYLAQITDTGEVSVERSTSLDCALMVNLYGSSGLPGPVLKITARKRKGQEKSFTECIRKAVIAAYGESKPVSLGGAFLVKTGKALFHVMPDFPPKEELPFESRKQVDDWLTYHDFEAPVVCLCVMHSADPGKKMDLRIEHTHAFSARANAGGHYHYEADGSADDIEYEGYFNTASVIYRIARPESNP